MPPLEPEQDFGAKWLRDRRVAMLADRVGFGKTAQIVLASELIDAKAISILCPPVLCENARSQFEQWRMFTDWPVRILKTGADDVPPDGIVICSYNLARTSRMQAKLAKRRADVLILDEAHALKSPSSVGAKAVFGKDGIGRAAARTWFVTGTPTPNNASEWFVFAKACGAWPGTFWQFVDRYCHCIDGHFGKKIVGSKPEMRAELLKLLSPHVLARDKVEADRLPLDVDTIAVDGRKPDFSEVDADTLAAIEMALKAEDWTLLDGPSVSTVRRLVGVAKGQAAAELIAYEMAENLFEKALVFCEHRAVIDLLAAKLGAAVIDGRTTDKAREAILASFEPGRSGPHRVCVIQRQALKEGRTLTQANRVFLVEPAWTPDDNKQMIARAWRRGQSRPVRASFVHLPGSLDEAVTRTLARKAADIEAVSVRS